MAFDPIGAARIPPPSPSSPIFLLGLTTTGMWVVRADNGSKGGLFRTRQAAIKYARDESANGEFTIVHQPSGLDRRAA
jgi:hypothetical protein